MSFDTCEIVWKSTFHNFHYLFLVLYTKNELFQKMFELSLETYRIVRFIENKNFDVFSPPHLFGRRYTSIMVRPTFDGESNALGFGNVNFPAQIDVFWHLDIFTLWKNDYLFLAWYTGNMRLFGQSRNWASRPIASFVSSKIKILMFPPLTVEDTRRSWSDQLLTGNHMC